MSEQSERRPTRRAVLTGGVASVAALIAGCTGSSGRSAAGATTSASGTPAATGSAVAPASASATVPLGVTPTSTGVSALPSWAQTVYVAESDLAATYRAVLKAHPALKPKLTDLLAAHVAHLTSLKSTLPGFGAADPGAHDVPIGQLIAAEQKASGVAAAQCVTCPSQAAALLGSIAAADASHVLVLQTVSA